MMFPDWTKSVSLTACLDMSRAMRLPGRKLHVHSQTVSHGIRCNETTGRKKLQVLTDCCHGHGIRLRCDNAAQQTVPLTVYWSWHGM